MTSRAARTRSTVASIAAASTSPVPAVYEGATRDHGMVGFETGIKRLRHREIAQEEGGRHEKQRDNRDLPDDGQAPKR